MRSESFGHADAATGRGAREGHGCSDTDARVRPGASTTVPKLIIIGVLYRCTGASKHAIRPSFFFERMPIDKLIDSHRSSKSQEEN